MDDSRPDLIEKYTVMMSGSLTDTYTTTLTDIVIRGFPNFD